MIDRKIYLDKLRSLRDTDLIKVITGVRRAGKSTLLAIFRDELLASGVAASDIVSLNFEDIANERLQDPARLHDFIVKTVGDRHAYVFLDEIQNVAQFEKVVDSLYIRKNIDLYITGSNAYFLSGDLATVLSGRYVELEVFPLSFAEYASAFEDRPAVETLLDDYLTYGGFPEMANLLAGGRREVVNDYILGIYNTVITKDIVQRNNISDITTLNGITKFLLSNVGSLVTPKKIADYLTSMQNKTSYNTADKYLSALVDGLIFYRADRRDIRGKQVLQTLQKYYVVDTGLRRAILGNASRADIGHLLENVVYFELLRRRNFVWVGKNKDTEVDFVARNIDTDEVVYYQVSLSTSDERVFDRELRPLQSIADHYPKVILTTDAHEFDEDGIRQMNITKWLLGLP